MNISYILLLLGTSKEDLGKQVDAVATAAQGPEDLVGEPSKDIRVSHASRAYFRGAH